MDTTKSPNMLRNLLVLFCMISLSLGASLAVAQERTMTEEQQKAIENDGELEVEVVVKKDRGNLPDLTKGERIKDRLPQFEWHLGPTGIIGYIPGSHRRGDQIEVTKILKGSPAEGVLQWGDVILGVGGQDFEPGSNVAMQFGKAIIEAEKEENRGELKLKVWRDKNFRNRFKKKDIAGADVDELFEKAESDDSLYEWKSEVEQEKEASSPNFKDFPIDAEVMDITVKLDVMPPYSDTSPYNCPKSKKILENAWKVLEQDFADGKIRANRKGTVAALALVASGKPEHREIVRKWVRSPNGKGWHPSITDRLDINKPGGYVSWRMSFDGLDCAIYYDATGDEFVLPAVKAYAVHTALGQSGAGSWGHTFAFPSFNGGELHGMNPGYGALNAAGNRCFMLIALAQKLGIEDPAIDRAVDRSAQFFGSYYEKGAIPYGHHGAAGTDDSNGKNVGVAFGLNFMGDKERARWFAQMSNHASFTRRGGHGNDYFWHYSPWAATMLGPRGTIATHRNLRWRFTLSRRHDGGFVIQSPTEGIQELRNATGTFVLHYSAPFKQTIWTGKDADESMFWTDREFDQLLAMTPGQFNDETLLEAAGTRVTERSTEQVIDFLDVFKPKTRHIYARELGKRYQAGEKDILPKMLALLKSDNPRIRDAAVHAIKACGRDAILTNMSKVIPLLKDESEFVRMQAARTIAVASDTTNAQKALLQATIDEDMSQTMGPNALPSVTQNIFMGDSKLATSPFEAGLDEELVEAALEKIITLDPAGNRPMLGSQNKVWDRETVVKMAGPLVYTAEEEQIADQMFSSRRSNSLALLERLGYQEAIDGAVSYLRKYNNIPRDVRQRVYFKRGNVEPELLMRHPEASVEHLDAIKLWLADKPLAVAQKGKPNAGIVHVDLYELVDVLKAAKTSKPMPRLADEVEKQFNQRLQQLPDMASKVALCRKELENPSRRNLLRQVAALKFLSKNLGQDAAPDVLRYLAHDNWRVREQAQASAVEIAKAGGDAFLIEAFGSADDPTAVSILEVLSKTKSQQAVQQARQATQHASPVVRGAALKAQIAIEGTNSFSTVFKAMKDADHNITLRLAERGLLTGKDDAAWMNQVQNQAIAVLNSSDTAPNVRESMYYLLGQVGGSQALSILKQAAESLNDQEFEAAINALSFSPDPKADKVITDLIAANAKKKRGPIIANRSVRRMVIGKDDIGERPVEEQLDYAEEVLRHVLDRNTITYLGRIQTGRAAFILQKTMKRGEPATAAKAIIAATRDLSDAPAKDRKLAERALVDTIEFIEVTKLRDGVSKLDWRTYPMWKAIVSEAGKNLLKLNETEKAPPPPAFDDLDLEL